MKDSFDVISVEKSLSQQQPIVNSMQELYDVKGHLRAVNSLLANVNYGYMQIEVNIHL